MFGEDKKLQPSNISEYDQKTKMNWISGKTGPDMMKMQGESIYDHMG